MSKLIIPDHIAEYHNPTPKQWLRWERFKERVKNMDFSALNKYFHLCSKGQSMGGLVHCGLHSTSSNKSFSLFPWMSFNKAASFCGTSISVSEETETDEEDIVCADNF